MILSPRFEQALQYAAVAHAGQLRKATRVPYLAHLLAVTALVLEHGGDEPPALLAELQRVFEELERRAEGDRYRPADGGDEEALMRAVAEAEAKHRRPSG